MTGNERDTLTQFLRDLQQTRPSEIDEQANGLINEVMSSHPHASYVLASRCILLVKQRQPLVWAHHLLIGVLTLSQFVNHLSLQSPAVTRISQLIC